MLIGAWVEMAKFEISGTHGLMRRTRPICSARTPDKDSSRRLIRKPVRTDILDQRAMIG
jgi:hypothetical protein